MVITVPNAVTTIVVPGHHPTQDNAHDAVMWSRQQLARSFTK